MGNSFLIFGMGREAGVTVLDFGFASECTELYTLQIYGRYFCESVSIAVVILIKSGKLLKIY